MKKDKKISAKRRLQQFCEEGKSNEKELTVKVYGFYDLRQYMNIGSMLSWFRNHGFYYFPMGRNGVVKVPENLQELQLVISGNIHPKTRGKLLRFNKFVRFAALERPKMKELMKPLTKELIMISKTNEGLFNDKK